MTTERLDNQPTPTPRPGERVQTWWCEGCESWHSGSVLGGLVVEHGEQEGVSDGDLVPRAGIPESY